MTDQWLQYDYQQHQTIDESAVPYGGLSDAVSVSSSFTATSDQTMNSNMVAPESSCAVGNDLSPRSSIGKPVRRRSRASRRTPTTLLNASIKNFRTLVQQYTGCQSVGSSTKNQKGPITLSFGSSSDHQQNHDFAARDDSFVGGYYSGHPHQFHQEQNQQYHHQEHIQMYQGQQGLFPSDENNGDFSAFSSSSGPNMTSVDNFGWQ